MQNHTKVYLEGMGYDQTDYIPCEVSMDQATDIHHIIGRGKMGEDRIENLMALTRENHEKYGDRKYLIPSLLRLHRRHLVIRGAKFDPVWIRNMIKKYEPYENNKGNEQGEDLA